MSCRHEVEETGRRAEGTERDEPRPPAQPALAEERHELVRRDDERDQVHRARARARRAIANTSSRHAVAMPVLGKPLSKPMANPDAVVVGSGPNGLPRRSSWRRPGRKVRRLRSRPDRRRRRAFGGADAAGLRARHLLGRPSVRASRRRSFARCRSPTTGSSGSSRRRCWRIRSTTGRRRSCERSLDDDGAGLGADADAYRRLIGADRRRLAAHSNRRCSGRCVCRASVRARAVRAAGASIGRACWRSAASRRARARAVRRHRRARHAAARPPADGRVALVLGALAHVAGWVDPARRRAAADRCARRVSAIARRRDRRRHARRRRSTICRRRARSSAICRRGRSFGSPAIGCRPRIAQARTLSLRHGRVQGGLGARRADPVARRGVPQRRRPCTSAARSRRSRARSATRGTGRIAERPFVLLAQPTLFDPIARAGGQARRVGVLPRAAWVDGRHAAAHRAQIERFAPGFRDRVLARR